jgi:hypothetical protein
MSHDTTAPHFSSGNENASTLRIVDDPRSFPMNVPTAAKTLATVDGQSNLIRMIIFRFLLLKK